MKCCVLCCIDQCDGQPAIEAAPEDLCEPCVDILVQRSIEDNFEDKYLLPLLSKRLDHTAARDFITSSLNGLKAGWTIELDVFYGGELANIIATLNPKASKRLVMGAHYDARTMGTATLREVDSGVPCAMLLHTASVLDELLAEQKVTNSDITLQLIFFDGAPYGDSSNVYGSRHLSEKWRKTQNLDSIHELIMLNLLGRKNPTITNHFEDTLSDFNHFKSVEKRLHDRNLLRDHAEMYFRDDLKPFDKTHFYDHYPFYSKMVPVLHFVDDSMKETPLNRAVLDEATIENLNIILCLFIAEYLCHH